MWNNNKAQSPKLHTVFGKEIAICAAKAAVNHTPHTASELWGQMNSHH